MKSLRLLILLFATAPLFAQTALTTTTLSAAVNGTVPNSGTTGSIQNYVILGSLANVNPIAQGLNSAIRSVLYVDREMMAVETISTLSGQVTVLRGYNGTFATPHNSGATVYVGAPDQFYLFDPIGACTAVLTKVTPWINIQNGNQWTCTAGSWALSGGPYFGGGGSFSSLTGGTNTAAAMLVGTGASLGPTGTGAITATAIQGPNGIPAITGPGHFILAQTCPTAATNCFTSTINGQSATDCSWSNTSTTVTCTTSHFVQADVGKRIWGFNTCATNQGPYTNLLGTRSQGAVTISTVNSGSNITVSQATTGAQTSPSCVRWGNPDDTAVASMETAASTSSACPTIVLPAGNVIITTPHFNTTNNVCLNNPTVGGATYVEFGYTVMGYGPGTSNVWLTPDFAFSSCPAAGCFSHGPGSVWYNFSLDGGGLFMTGAGPTFTLFAPTTPGANFPFGVFMNFSCTNIGGGDTNSTLFNMTASNTILFTQYAMFDGCAAITKVGDGTHLTAIWSLNSAWEDQAGVACSFCGGNTTPFVVAANSQFNSEGGNAWAMGPVFTSNSSVMFLNTGGIVRLGPSDQLNSANGSSAVLVTYGTSGSGAQTWAHQTLFGQPTVGVGNGGNSAYTITSTNDQSFIRDSVFLGGSSGSAINVNASGAIFQDGGGNFFAGSGNAAKVLVTSGSYNAVGHQISAACTGTVTASSTLGLFGTGPNVTATTCTSTTIGSGIVMQSAGTLRNLNVTATAAGVNASSGAVTVLKNGSSQTMTCTIGTGTSCQDGAHTVTFVTGDLISIQFTTQTADTLAGVKANIIYSQP